MANEVHWRISSAIAYEVDAALSLSLSESFRRAVPSFADTADSMPADWYEQGHRLLEGRAGDFFSLISRLAAPMGLVEADDYSQVTLRMREASAEEVEEAALATARREGLELDAGAGPLETLVGFNLAIRQAAGVPFPEGGEGPRRLRRECELALQTTRGGDLHSHFWHWLDRFYYESYQPWRQQRQGFMDGERDRALQALGAEEGDGAPPLSWLPRQNPLARPGPLLDRARSNTYDVVFWVEPLGAFDLIALLPNALLVTFGVPGEALESFRRRAEELSGKLKAIADPTRLTILRIVRQLEVDNTDIAEYMELSHPTISVHAKTLREAGLIQSRREGRRLLHKIDPKAVRRLMRELESFLGLPPE